MAIQDISLGTAGKPHDRAFNVSTYALTQLYATYVPAFDSAGIVKVCLGVVDTAGARDVASLATGPVLRLLNVVEVDLCLDLSWYATLPDPARAQLQLEVLHAGCLAVGTAQQWDPQPFHAAYAQCQRAHLTNAWVMQVGKKRFVSSPDRRSKACLVCLWTLHSFRVELVVMAKATRDAHVTPLLENEAHDPVRFETLRWVDNQTVEVTARYPQREWQVEVTG